MPAIDLRARPDTAREAEVNTGTAKFALLMSMRQEALRGTLQYNTDLFAKATILRLVGHFRTLLEGIVTPPEQRLAGLPLLTPADRHQLLVEWNDTDREYPKDACLHELFEAQVERTPEAVAVVFEDQQLHVSMRYVHVLKGGTLWTFFCYTS